MASLEKLTKAFEALRVFQPEGLILETKRKDQPLSKKEKITNITVIADCVCSTSLRSSQDFAKLLGISVEAFLAHCDDPESDVRIVADECLNRTIKTLLETHLGRLQVDLYKELKKHGNQRSLRAALWRFADLCHLIRPHKCRPYVTNLLPCLARICRRPEESVQETLSQAMAKLCPVLVSFMNENEIKVLLKAFIPNLSFSQATARRTAASALSLICTHARKPAFFCAYLLTTLLEVIIPTSTAGATMSAHTLLGVFLALRHLVPLLGLPPDPPSTKQAATQTAKQSSGQGKEATAGVRPYQLQQMFEALVYYLDHSDHNVINASLDTLQTLLRTPPPALLAILRRPGGLKKSGLEREAGDIPLRHRTDSQPRLSLVADDLPLDDEFDTPCGADSEVKADSEVSMVVGSSGSDLTSLSKTDATEDSADSDTDEEDDLDGEVLMSPGAEDSYSGIDIGAVIDDVPPSATEPISQPDTEPDTENEAVGLQTGQTIEAVVTTQPDRRLGMETATGEELQSQRHDTFLVADDATLRKGVSDERLVESDYPTPLQLPSVASTNEIAATHTNSSAAKSHTRTVSSGSEVLAVREGCVGELNGENSMPLEYLVRLIASKFLLTGYPKGIRSDRQVRVSVKALSVGCLGAVVSLMPGVMLLKVHTESDQQGELQDVCDVLLLSGHADPQVKGAVALLVANLVQAVITETAGNFSDWAKTAKRPSLSLKELLSQLGALLSPACAQTARHALVGVRVCLAGVLHSRHAHLALPVLLSALRLALNPYWLLKVELCELLGGLDMRVLAYLEKLCQHSVNNTGQFHARALELQNKVVHESLVRFLDDEDSRVRTAAASALVTLVPRLFHAVDEPQQDCVVAHARRQVASLLEPVMHEHCAPLPARVHGLGPPYHTQHSYLGTAVEWSLSRVLQAISQRLNSAQSKHTISGCLQALRTLSEQYPSTLYPHAWGCASAKPAHSANTGLQASQGGGLFPLLLALLTSSPAALDPTTHTDALITAGSIFAGAALSCLRPNRSAAADSDSEAGGLGWSSLSERALAPVADALLSHAVRMLCVCAHVLDEQVPTAPAAPRPTLPSLPVTPSLSPIKRKAKGGKEEGAAQEKANEKQQVKEPGKEATDKGRKESLGAFYNLPHYMEIYETLRSVNASYKISLELSSGEKLSGLLRATLTVLGQLLEVAGLCEVGRHAEELLGYLRAAMSRQPTDTVATVQQLLKALFGTNLASQSDGGGEESGASGGAGGGGGRLTLNIRPGLYHCCVTAPYTQFTQCLASMPFRASSHSEQDENSWLNLVKKRVERKVPAVLRPGSTTDKTTIANYIRLFEPLVIKSLKQYTMTSDVLLQRQVLNLLIQLVHLRVNYCLLDSDQIFIQFVIKQFEFIEEGQIRCSAELVPDVFNFLVLLSYERYLSKSIIGFPKIIQLCDGVMASGQDPTTHAIPALQALVLDLFVARGQGKGPEAASKDMETQREVLISRLLRLVQHHEVLELLILVLHQSRRESEEKWKRLSRQVTDRVLPELAQLQVQLHSMAGLDVLHRLFEVVAPSVFRPLDILLKTLFAPPPPSKITEPGGLGRWLGLVLVLLRVFITHAKEETLLARLRELSLHVHVTRGLQPSRCRAEPSGDEVAEMDAAAVGDTAALAAGVEKDTTQNPVLCRQGAGPEEVFARFLLQVVGLAISEIVVQTTSLPASPAAEPSFLCKSLAHLLLYLTHMFQSGMFRRVANACAQLQQTDGASVAESEKPGGATPYSGGELNALFARVHCVQPVITLQWCYVLALLGYHDLDYWSRLMLTNKRYITHRRCEAEGSGVASEGGVSGGLLAKSRSLLQEVSRRGALILYCDLLCGNLGDVDRMTWVIVNHVNDLMLLAAEPPVQDFIGALHNNCAASGLLLQAVNSRCEHISSPGAVRRLLRCLEGLHPSQSGALLVLLLDKFLGTPHLAVARQCHLMACTHLELLLVLQPQEARQQLSECDIERMLETLAAQRLGARYERLVTLLRKLRTALYGTQPPSKQPVQHDTSATVIHKDFFERLVRRECGEEGAGEPRQCARLLQHLDYSAILSLTMHKDFRLPLLRECLLLGLRLSLEQYQRVQERTLLGGPQLLPPAPDLSISEPTSPSHLRPLHDLYKATQVTVLRDVNSVVNTLPMPHRMLRLSAAAASADDEYTDKMLDLFTEVSWLDTVFALCDVLLEYLRSLQVLPWKPEVPEEAVKDITRFTVVSLEVLHYQLSGSGLCPPLARLAVCLELLVEVLRHSRMRSLLERTEHVTWACTAIRCVHQMMTSLLLLPVEKLTDDSQHHEAPDEGSRTPTDDVQLAVRACDQVSELMQCLRTHLATSATTLPLFLVTPLRTAIIGLARLSLVNSYARTPPEVWRLGWMPSPRGELHTQLPSPPLDLLQERDVLRAFIASAVTLGWTSRQQFEETWVCLLGVLNPAAERLPGAGSEEDLERVQCVTMATRGVTALLVQTMLQPRTGDPSSSCLELIPRDVSIPFLQTRVGRRLTNVRGIVQEEMDSLATQGEGAHLSSFERRTPTDAASQLYVTGMERQRQHVRRYSLAQLSVAALWQRVGLLDDNQPPDVSGGSTSGDATSTIKPRLSKARADRLELSRVAAGREPSVDVRSCVQLLLDLYGQRLNSGTATPLMLVNQTLLSVLCLSDVFTERAQYEWMLTTFLDMYRAHAPEDELSLQYLIAGICKAAAVTGLEASQAERIVRLLETHLRSTHLPTKMAVLWGVLWLLEAGLSELTTPLLPHVTEHLLRSLASCTTASILCEHHVMLMWACAFYIYENCMDEVKDMEFLQKILQVALTWASNKDGMTSGAVFTEILAGLERLILAHVLTSADTENVVKMAVERLNTGCTQRALASLGLLLTAMYSGKQMDQWSPTTTDFSAQSSEPLLTGNTDPESLIIAMEKVNVLFDRMRRGSPYEARVLSRVLPHFLTDFFPSQDIMNKIIGEFLSSQQPHPALIASVIFKVFERLLSRGDRALVQEWVLLSLSNFTQRTPQAMAMWSLTAFFTCASQNTWLRALWSHILSRVGNVTAADEQLFLLAARDFHSQLPAQAQRHTFLQTFRATQHLNPVYGRLVDTSSPPPQAMAQSSTGTSSTPPPSSDST